MEEKDKSEFDRTLKQASVYFEQQEWDIAEELFKEALEVQPSEPYCLAQLTAIASARNSNETLNEEYAKTLLEDEATLAVTRHYIVQW